MSGTTRWELGPLFLLCRHSFKGSHSLTTGLGQLGVSFCSQQRNVLSVTLQSRGLTPTAAGWLLASLLLFAFSFLLFWSPPSTLNTFFKGIMTLLVFHKVSFSGDSPKYTRSTSFFLVWFLSLEFQLAEHLGGEIQIILIFISLKYKVMFFLKAEGKDCEGARSIYCTMTN